MSQPIISAENLGKRYRIRHHQEGRGYVALRDVVTTRVKASIRSLGGEPRAPRPDVEDFWALQGVSFEVTQGEVIGLIGRNGAGKSTLLKVLSRITEPTEGRVTLRGRVASLLEVGTGFHPELTGRENILLNGAILGMGRAEILRKFDEIVAFAEVEQFLDTPVKRYSSGMYVRLAFAVAAHLEPEILIVDEVLAVGDAEFQKKCLGKMQEVSKGGRTVLFVSHNMAAVRSLTSRTILLSRGSVAFDGSSSAAIERYFSAGTSRRDRSGSHGKGKHTSILSVALLDAEDRPVEHYSPGHPFRLEIVLVTDGATGLSIDVFLADAGGQKIGMASSAHFHGCLLPSVSGHFKAVLELSPLWLASGTYSIDVTTALVNIEWDHYVDEALEFEVVSSNPGGLPWDFRQSLNYGTVAMLMTSNPEWIPAECGDSVFEMENSTGR